MDLTIDLFCDEPQLILHFNTFDDMSAFLVGLMEEINE